VGSESKNIRCDIKQIFKNLIYFDSQKVADYSALLKGERQIDIKKYKKNTSKSFKGGAYIASGNYDNIDEFEVEL